MNFFFRFNFAIPSIHIDFCEAHNTLHMASEKEIFLQYLFVSVFVNLLHITIESSQNKLSHIIIAFRAQAN